MNCMYVFNICNASIARGSEKSPSITLKTKKNIRMDLYTIRNK